MCHSKEQIASATSSRLFSFAEDRRKRFDPKRHFPRDIFFHILVYFTIRMCKHAETRPQREWVGIEVDSEKKEQRLPPRDVYRFILSFLCRLFSPTPPYSLSLSLQLGFFFVKKFASDSWEEMNSLLTLSARDYRVFFGRRERKALRYLLDPWCRAGNSDQSPSGKISACR